MDLSPFFVWDAMLTRDNLNERKIICIHGSFVFPFVSVHVRFLSGVTWPSSVWQLTFSNKQSASKRILYFLKNVVTLSFPYYCLLSPPSKVSGCTFASLCASFPLTTLPWEGSRLSSRAVKLSSSIEAALTLLTCEWLPIVARLQERSPHALIFLNLVLWL